MQTLPSPQNRIILHYLHLTIPCLLDEEVHIEKLNALFKSSKRLSGRGSNLAVLNAGL